MAAAAAASSLAVAAPILIPLVKPAIATVAKPFVDQAASTVGRVGEELFNLVGNLPGLRY
ncbi:hypothetical protein [Pseudomonas rhodesiae]|uniref:hypothetical protein n=1 Tax=Pseudomonas rhodesiae TaxID=76760 RepID=UPI0011B65D6B|nr:hypothetical protein [Pseudomonas rhodesiae]TWR55784.1 hypothetical protein FIV35_09310 [Pseudomonas rhodesiae]